MFCKVVQSSFITESVATISVFTGYLCIDVPQIKFYHTHNIRSTFGFYSAINHKTQKTGVNNSHLSQDANPHCSYWHTHIYSGIYCIYLNHIICQNPLRPCIKKIFGIFFFFPNQKPGTVLLFSHQVLLASLLRPNGKLRHSDNLPSFTHSFPYFLITLQCIVTSLILFLPQRGLKVQGGNLHKLITATSVFIGKTLIYFQKEVQS